MQTSKIRRMVEMAALIAVIVVLQAVATFVKIGPFPITLTLIPIVLGATLYGPKTGAVLGGAFGVVVLIMVITGADPGGNLLWQVNPLLTALLCLLKGILAGFVAGIVNLGVKKINAYAGVICAAVVCPIVNTGIFIAGMALFFHATLVSWAGDTNVVYYALIGLTGINFLIEFIANAVMGPVLFVIGKVLRGINV